MEWFDRHRETIGYVVGGLNIIGGINDLLSGNISNGTMFLILGVFIVFDAKTQSK